MSAHAATFRPEAIVTDLPPAIPAATLILMRDRVGSPPEVLFVVRSAAMAFAPGALAFPGGRLDPGDEALGTDEDGAARIAAIRETVEETGILVATDAPAGAAGPLRAALAAGRPFADALAEAGATLRPDRLVPFARWRPDHALARRFDTRFFVARAPAGAVPVADGAEIARSFWASAADVLAQVDDGRAAMIFPTRRTVERLATYASVDAALADAAARPIRTITPWAETRDDEDWLCIPDDLGFPVTAERLDRARRS